MHRPECRPRPGIQELCGYGRKILGVTKDTIHLLLPDLPNQDLRYRGLWVALKSYLCSSTNVDPPCTHKGICGVSDVTPLLTPSTKEVTRPTDTPFQHVSVYTHVALILDL